MRSLTLALQILLKGGGVRVFNQSEEISDFPLREVKVQPGQGYITGLVY